MGLYGNTLSSSNIRRLSPRMPNNSLDASGFSGFVSDNLSVAWLTSAASTQTFGRARVKTKRVRLVDWFSRCCASCEEESCASGRLNGRAPVWGLDVVGCDGLPAKTDSNWRGVVTDQVHRRERMSVGYGDGGTVWLLIGRLASLRVAALVE